MNVIALIKRLTVAGSDRNENVAPETVAEIFRSVSGLG